MSSSKWIAVLNSDDVFDSGKIERCLDISRDDPKIELISGKIDFIDNQDRNITDGVSKNWMERSLEFYRKTNSLPLGIINENFITTSSNMVFKKDLWLRTGGFRDYRYCNDLDFLLRAFQSGTYYFDDKIKHLNYRIHHMNTISENILDIRLERAYVTYRGISRLKFKDLEIKYLVEALNNLKLGQHMFVIDCLIDKKNDDMVEWNKVKKLMLIKEFSDSLDF
jgi:GT2 family glycosyltransferase